MLMTNNELAQAIEVANQRVRDCGTGQPNYEPLLEHLKALLAEQRRRATAQPVFTPAVPVQVHPAVIPQPKWWAPQTTEQPPYTITCGAGFVHQQ